MPEENKPLDYRSAIARIRQERSDAGKALSAAQVNLGSDLKKKGEAGAFGSTVGKYLGPIIGDYLVGGFLNLVAPGVGTLYQSAKSNPLLKAGGTAAYSYAGSKTGGDIGAGTVDVRDATKEVKSYLGDTMSGERAMRFDRGATESLSLQTDEQIKVLDDLIKQKAIGDAGSAFFKSVSTDVLSGMKTDLSKTAESRELTSQDYLDALVGSRDKDSITGKLFDFSGLDFRSILPGSPLADAPGEGTGITSSMMSSPLNYEKLLSDLSKVQNKEINSMNIIGSEEIDYGRTY